MSYTVDARGLSCPQPVLMTLNKIKEMGTGKLLVMVDTQASKENVSRAAENSGWTLRAVSTEGEEYHLTLVKE